MILGLSTFAYGWSIGIEGSVPPQPFDETHLIQKALQFGLQCIQFGDNLPLHTLPSERLENLKDEAKTNNIRIEIGARKLTEDNLDRYIELAAHLHSPLLRFVIDGNDYEPDRDTIISIIKNSIPKLNNNNLILGVENHDRFKATELAAMLDAVGSDKVGVCLDCVNSLGAGEGLDWVSSVLIPYTVNLHIKDFEILRLPHKMGFTVKGTPAGKGMSNVPGLLKELSLHRRCVSAVLEQWIEPESSIEETVKKEDDWAAESLQYLKALTYFKTIKKV